MDKKPRLRLFLIGGHPYLLPLKDSENGISLTALLIVIIIAIIVGILI